MGKERYILYALAIWRLSNLLVDEEGPFHVFAKLRHKVGVKHDAHNKRYGETFLSEILTCVYCVSVWISIIFVICDKIHKGSLISFSIPMALSAGAILVNSQIKRGT